MLLVTSVHYPWLVIRRKARLIEEALLKFWFNPNLSSFCNLKGYNFADRLNHEAQTSSFTFAMLFTPFTSVANSAIPQTVLDESASTMVFKASSSISIDQLVLEFSELTLHCANIMGAPKRNNFANLRLLYSWFELATENRTKPFLGLQWVRTNNG